MKRTATLLAALAVAFAGAAATVRTATETFVTNKIAAAIAAIPSPDFTTNNAALVETIEAKAPAPGNYATVSNRAMTAMQSHQSLQPSTNYTDAAIAAFASTGAVARANVYGTPTRWTDATGCVWEVTNADTYWHVTTNGIPHKTLSWNGTYWSDDNTQLSYYGGSWFFTGHWIDGSYAGPADIPSFTVVTYITSYGSTLEAEVGFSRYCITNLVGRVALKNDIPDVSGYATPADVTAAIREQSLGGIWDETLQVWWTPRMRSGSLTYEATTNVNLNAEN